MAPDRQSHPRRILLVTTVELTLRSFLLPLTRALQREGWEVHGAARGISDNDLCRTTFDRVWEVPWPRSLRSVPALIRGAAAIRRIATSADFEVVHVHTPIAAFLTRFALRRERRKHGIRVIYTAHGFNHSPHLNWFANRAFLWLERLAGRWTDDLVVMNDEDFAWARARHLVPDRRVHLTRGMGIATALWPPTESDPQSADRIRRDLDLQPDDRLFCMVAEFIPRKRHQDVVRALAALGRPEVHVAFAGTDNVGGMWRRSVRSRVAALATSLGVSDQVHFLDFRSDVHALMRASVATILPSQREGRPMAVLESICAGVPVIGSDIKGTRDLLIDGGGLLYPMGDVPALTTAMRRILDSPTLTTKLVAAGRVTAERHEESAVLQEHLAIIAAVTEDD